MRPASVSVAHSVPSLAMAMSLHAAGTSVGKSYLAESWPVLRLKRAQRRDAGLALEDVRVVARPQHAVPVVGEHAEQRAQPVVRVGHDPRLGGLRAGPGAIDRPGVAAVVEIARGVGGQALGIDPAAVDRHVARRGGRRRAGPGDSQQSSQHLAPKPHPSPSPEQSYRRAHHRAANAREKGPTAQQSSRSLALSLHFRARTRQDWRQITIGIGMTRLLNWKALRLSAFTLLLLGAWGLVYASASARARQRDAGPPRGGGPAGRRTGSPTAAAGQEQRFSAR